MINGRRYMDGGMGSTTNAELAAGYERVLARLRRLHWPRSCRE
jgi:hypothetical protein